MEKKELDWAAVSEVFYREHFGSFADILLSGDASKIHERGMHAHPLHLVYFNLQAFMRFEPCYI